MDIMQAILPTKSLSVLLALLLTVISVCPATADSNDKSVDPTEEPAKLIVYRNRISPPINFKPLIKINNKNAFYLTRGHSAELTLHPGDYEVVADWPLLSGVGDRTKTITLEVGKVTYLNASSTMSTIFVGPIAANVTPQLSSKLDDSSEAPDLTKLAQIYSWLPGWPDYRAPTKNLLEKKYNLNFDEHSFLLDYKNADLVQKKDLLRFVVHHKLVSDDFIVASIETLDESLHQETFNKLELYTLISSLKILGRHESETNKNALLKVFNEAKNKKVASAAKKILKRSYGVSAE